MDYAFSDDEQAFQTELRRFAANVLAPHYQADDAAAELGEEVLVGVGDFLDEAVGAQALDQVGGAGGREPCDVGAQIAGAEAGDGPLAARQGEE